VASVRGPPSPASASTCARETTAANHRHPDISSEGGGATAAVHWCGSHRGRRGLSLRKGKQVLEEERQRGALGDQDMQLAICQLHTNIGAKSVALDGGDAGFDHFACLGCLKHRLATSAESGHLVARNTVQNLLCAKFAAHQLHHLDTPTHPHPHGSISSSSIGTVANEERGGYGHAQRTSSAQLSGPSYLCHLGALAHEHRPEDGVQLHSCLAYSQIHTLTNR
jgi:hypothetical protein